MMNTIIKPHWKFLLICLLIVPHEMCAQDNSEIDILHSRLYADYMNTISSSAALSYFSSQLSDGSWSDINYSDRSITNWDPVKHVERIKIMSHAYNNAGNNATHQNQDLLNGINKGLVFWASRGCRSDNWWFNDIGQQRQLGVIVVLMKGAISSQAMESATRFLVMPAAQQYGTNLVWVSTGLLQHGIAVDSEAMIREAVENIRSTIYIKSQEGVQRDYSFLFHGMQLYNGGYGSWLIGDVTLWMYHLRELEIGFNQFDINIMTRFLLEGDQWMMRNNQYDFGSGGRNITRKSGLSSSHLKTYLERMKELNPDKANEFQDFIDHINKNNNSSLVGNKHFWRADYMVNRTSAAYTAVKMCSNRTNGTEFMNNENKLGFWLPFGATCIMKNASEYYNIYPLWDWTKIPGVTCPEVTPSFGSVQNQSKSFVGGVSNESFGIACMDFEKERVSARKSWFFFENEFVALGAGITSSHEKKVNTTLNQCKKVGSVLVNGTAAPTAANQSFSNTSWLHHGNIAYIFPDPTSVMVSNTNVSGTWNQINGTESSATVTGDVVKLWINHGIQPQGEAYAYIVNPSIFPHEMDNYVNNLPVRIEVNSQNLQVVSYPDKKLTGYVFFTAGIHKAENDIEITASSPCAIIVDQSTNPVTFTVSDPSQSLSELQLGINYGAGQYETLSIDLPNNDNRGKSVTVQASTILKNGPEGIWIVNKPVLPLDRLENLQLEHTLILAEEGNNQVSWESADPGTVTVTETGLIFAKNYGNTVIRVSANEGMYQDEVVVDVKKKIIDEPFDNCADIVYMDGGSWECSGGSLQLVEAMGASIPSPENNMALFNIPLEGDFVLNAQAWVQGSISPFNDFCLVWDHQHPENSYNYIHLCERNDNAGSGYFMVEKGEKSIELKDVALPIKSDTWIDVILKKSNSRIQLFVNGQEFLTESLMSDRPGIVGFGSYNDPAKFDDLKVWVDADPLLIGSKQHTIPASSVGRIYPVPAGDVLNIELNKEWHGADIRILDITGRIIHSVSSCPPSLTLNLENAAKGICILQVIKETEGTEYLKFIRN